MRKTYSQRWGRDRTKTVKASKSGKARVRKEGALGRLEKQLKDGKKRVKDGMVTLTNTDVVRMLTEKHVLETKLQ